MKTRLSERIHHIAAAALVVAIGFAVLPESSPANGIPVCGSTIACNDTAVSAGREAASLPRDQLRFAADPHLAFIGADHRMWVARPAALGPLAASPATGALSRRPDLAASVGWTFEIADSFAVADGCSMAIDSLGQPMVAYQDKRFGRLMLARRLGGVWTRQIADASGHVGAYTSVALVPGGIGIAYSDSVDSNVGYAEKIGAQPWLVGPVDGLHAGGAFPSLVSEGTGRAVAYFDGAHSQLRVAYSTGYSGAARLWTSELVDGALGAGFYNSIVGHPASDPSHFWLGIAYWNDVAGSLRYAWRHSGAWTLASIDSGGVGVSCSAVTFSDSTNDAVGIGYEDYAHGRLKYAQKHGSWVTTVQDTIGGNTACAATNAPGDTLGILYSDVSTERLYYLTHAGTVEGVAPHAPAARLELQWLRGAGSAGGRIRFSVPAAGRVRIRLYDAMGRVTAAPLDERLSAGDADVLWDGRDTAGRLVASGVYFVRVETAAGSASIPAVVLR